jgi:hypothetical protein
MVDALASGASGRKAVEVRVFSWAPTASLIVAPGRPAPADAAAARLGSAAGHFYEAKEVVSPELSSTPSLSVTGKASPLASKAKPSSLSAM